ncbi:MAG: GDSL-type esterase/lipase family protein, partial [Bacteroidota bacterium]
QTSDLIYFANELVLSHKPSKIFIYEGDNDLAEGKSVDIVLADMKTLFHVIRRQLPDTPIYLISPKPSPARLALRPKYEELNYLLSYLCPERDITFINLWDEMIDEFGDVKEDLFIEDGLHMNQDGYKIMAQAIVSHLN